MAAQLGQSRTVVAHRKHTAEIVVNRTSENTAKDNPQIGNRTKLRTHDGTEDGTRTGNVKELDHENLPVGKHDVIKSVGLC